MKKVFQMLAFWILTIGCAAAFAPVTLVNYPSSGITQDCDSAFTEQEIQFVKEYQKSIFLETEWERNYFVEEDHVFVARISDPLSAVVSIDLVRLCDSATELKNYVSAENIKVTLENYDAYEITDSCEKDGVSLFQFWAMAHDEKYNGHLWFQPIPRQPHRVVAIFMVFPELDSKNLSTYSSAFFPDFSSCK